MENNTKIFNSSKNFHLAGIVPIAGQPLDFNMNWHDSLFPIKPDYTLLESAIYECAVAGCDTIWIVADKGSTPLLRYRVGDFIQDPVWFNRKEYNSQQSRRRIPIFWTPVHPKNKDKRDCLSWSVIEGALSCLKTSSQISKWVTPDKYYVSFPYGIIDPEVLRPHRRQISSPKNFYLSHNSKTVQDNLHLSFTFGKEEFIRYRRNIRQGTGAYTSELTNGMPRTMLPIEQRWSARFFDLKDVFNGLDLEEANVLEVDDFYNVASWSEYTKFINTDFCNKLNIPGEEIFSYREFNSIGKDLED